MNTRSNTLAPTAKRRPPGLACMLLAVAGCAAPEAPPPPGPDHPASPEAAGAPWAAAPNPYSAPVAEAPGAPPAGALYTCPMHPEIRSDQPGDCHICGMPLVPVKSGAEHEHGGGA